MSKLVYCYDDAGYYIGNQLCQLNPVATEREEEDVYLFPANSTEVQPPEESENEIAKWDGKAWSLESLPEPEDDESEPLKDYGDMFDPISIASGNTYDTDPDSMSALTELGAILALDPDYVDDWITNDNRIVKMDRTEYLSLMKAIKERKTSHIVGKKK